MLTGRAEALISDVDGLSQVSTPPSNAVSS
jgi:hypothetical protein